MTRFGSKNDCVLFMRRTAFHIYMHHKGLSIKTIKRLPGLRLSFTPALKMAVQLWHDNEKCSQKQVQQTNICINEHLSRIGGGAWIFVHVALSFCGLIQVYVNEMKQLSCKKRHMNENVTMFFCFSPSLEATQQEQSTVNTIMLGTYSF